MRILIEALERRWFFAADLPVVGNSHPPATEVAAESSWNVFFSPSGSGARFDSDYSGSVAWVKIVAPGEIDIAHLSARVQWPDGLETGGDFSPADFGHLAIKTSRPPPVNITGEGEVWLYPVVRVLYNGQEIAAQAIEFPVVEPLSNDSSVRYSRTINPGESIDLTWFHSIAPESEPDDYEAMIDWGDGRVRAGQVSINGTRIRVHDSVYYAESGTYTVTVTIRAGGRESTNSTIVTAKGYLSHAVPQPTGKKIGDREIVLIEFDGRQYEAVGGEWIVSLCRPLPGMRHPYPGWEMANPGYNDFWRIPQPALNDLLDQTGLQYTFGGFLGVGTAFVIRVDPRLSQAQVYEALRSLPEIYVVEPNYIAYATGGEPDDVTPAPADPAPPAQWQWQWRDHYSAPHLLSRPGMSSLFFNQRELFETDEPLLEGLSQV